MLQSCTAEYMPSLYGFYIGTLFAIITELEVQTLCSITMLFTRTLLIITLLNFLLCICELKENVLFFQTFI